MSVIAVAALSARMLAEAANADGFEVVALDAFGDADTRRACSRWLPLAAPGSLEIDADLLLAALRLLARRGDVLGWIAGSGFEGRPELLRQGADLLPLIGTPADAVRRVRDPQRFFGVLAEHGIAYPEIRTEPPAEPDGWLVKDARGCGGWQVRRAAAQPAGPKPPHHSPHQYFQREMGGVPMSATFIANGRDACVLGFNQMIVRPFDNDSQPYVYCGVVGPVPIEPSVARRLTDAARLLAREFALQGVCSLDFMLDGASTGVLEINPRPPASMALYGATTFAGSADAATGIVRAHVRACLQAELPRLAAAPPPGVQATEIVFAPHRLRLDDAAAGRLAASADCHDLPAAETQFSAGDPVCSISAAAASVAEVLRLLERSRSAVLRTLKETTT